MRFGQWLRENRKAKGVSQAALAELVSARGINATAGYISNLEREYYKNQHGEPSRPNEKLVDTIAAVLDASPDDARRAAGYASIDLPMMELDGLRFAPLHAEQYTPEELEELKQTIEISYGIFKRRVEERKKQEG